MIQHALYTAITATALSVMMHQLSVFSALLHCLLPAPALTRTTATTSTNMHDTKREAAKDEAARKASELRARQRAMQASGQSAMTGIGGGGGYGSSDMSGMNLGDVLQQNAAAHSAANSSATVGLYATVKTRAGMPPYSPADSYSPSIPTAAPTVMPTVTSNRVPAKGMKLGGASSKGPKNTMLDSAAVPAYPVSVVVEEKLSMYCADIVMRYFKLAYICSLSTLTAPSYNTLQMHTHCTRASYATQQRNSAQLTREGALEQLEVKGTLSVTANAEDASRCKIVLAPPTKGTINPNINYQTHPKVNKALYESGRVLALKDAGKGFPVARPVGVLRWSLTTNDEAAMPLTINCWPEEEGNGVMNVNIEYTLQGVCAHVNERCHSAVTACELCVCSCDECKQHGVLKPLAELQDVRITIPLGCSEVPRVQAVDGQHRHNAQANTLIWHMDIIDKVSLLSMLTRQCSTASHPAWLLRTTSAANASSSSSISSSSSQ
eukprot:6343-Heterococcus_DN1.PRE.1